MNSGKPFRKSVGRDEDQQVLVLSNLRLPDTGREEEERSQMIGLDPKTEVGTPSPQRK